MVNVKIICSPNTPTLNGQVRFPRKVTAAARTEFKWVCWTGLKEKKGSISSCIGEIPHMYMQSTARICIMFMYVCVSVCACPHANIMYYILYFMVNLSASSSGICLHCFCFQKSAFLWQHSHACLILSLFGEWSCPWRPLILPKREGVITRGKPFL